MFDPATSGVIVAGLLVFFLTTGVHIGVALGLSGFLGIFITIGERAAMAQLAIADVPECWKKNSLSWVPPSG